MAKTTENETKEKNEKNHSSFHLRFLKSLLKGQLYYIRRKKSIYNDLQSKINTFLHLFVFSMVG